GAAPERAPILEPSPADERTRKLAWAGYALYLSAWSAGFAGVDFPAHLLLLELGLAAPMLIVAARRRSIAIAAPLFATWTHWAIHTRSLRAPQSMLQWGITTISAGFALLFLSLFASWRLRDTTPAHPTEGAPR
ncbi:MAG: hypothetical protein HYV09_31535, partial [Deltaproteobacteria bacterium]|nr:hypothetical protein [Deltaproteobacteria bacterium]